MRQLSYHTSTERVKRSFNVYIARPLDCTRTYTTLSKGLSPHIYDLIHSGRMFERLQRRIELWIGRIWKAYLSHD